MIAKIDEYYLQEGPDFLVRTLTSNIPFWLLRFYEVSHAVKSPDNPLKQSEEEWRKEWQSGNLQHLAAQWSNLANLEWFLHKDVSKFQYYLRRSMRLILKGYRLSPDGVWGTVYYRICDFLACGDLPAYRDFYFHIRGEEDRPLTDWEKIVLDPHVDIQKCEYRDSDFLKGDKVDPGSYTIIGLVERDSEMWQQSMKAILKKHRTQVGSQEDILNLSAIGDAILAKARGMELKFKHRLLPAELQIPYSVPAELEASYPTSVSLFSESWERYIRGDVNELPFIHGDKGRPNEPENIAENERWASALYDEIQRGTFVLNE